jgi:sulfate transport system permease protein
LPPTDGWGQYLVPLGIKVPFTPLGVVLALTFVGLPFVRSHAPARFGENLEREIEEAAATLGPSGCARFAPYFYPPCSRRLSRLRARLCPRIGEYGSVVFISGNQPYKTEIAPYLIWMRLEEYDYNGAISLAVVLLVISFALLAIVNWLEHWASRYQS